MKRDLNHEKVNLTGAEEGNPLLKWIPNIKDDEDMIKWLAADPFRDPVWCETRRDFSLLPNYLNEVFVPTPSAVKLARTLLTVLRKNYAQRDPRKSEFWTSYYHNMVNPELTYSEPNAFQAEGTSISGITGVGKTRIIDRVLSRLPQTIQLKEVGSQLASVTQIVWLKLDMSTAGGLEELLRELWSAIDTCLQRTDEQPDRLNLPKMIPEIIRKLKTHFCGILVFDEVQNINFGKSGITERVRNFVMKLLNNGIPIVLAGNPRGFTFEEKDGKSSQLVRRLAATDRIRLDPAEGPDEDGWRILVRGLWRCQLLPERGPLTREVEELLFRLTGGFPAALIRLLAESQQLAAHQGQEFLTVAIIMNAAKISPFLKEMKPIIDAFVAKDAVRLNAYSDIDWCYFQSKWATGHSRNNGDLLSGGEVSSSLRSPATSRDIVAKDQRAFKVSQTRRANKNLQSNGSASITAQGSNLLDELDAFFQSKCKKNDDG
ncbi:ATP-binding protein [Sulfurirhabdus autotrophica]|uniref:AAA domain-containing protein n=1 Tax=Sulfurirhabdus autotrophica TaxID=1706046 RepID=A0A4V2W0V9_9PROT|nr:ATP-binding protein [Sulfurirhabdus autotrophica]TCV81065.1 AAA domain-containing protein [Sulfurirhabdus autotrophica]